MANIVHDLIGTPSRRTVHAPQLVVSQPMCVPVNPSSPRRKCTSSMRGCTAAERRWPFTTSSICCTAGSVSSIVLLPHLVHHPFYGLLAGEIILSARFAAAGLGGARHVAGSLRGLLVGGGAGL